MLDGSYRGRIPGSRLSVVIAPSIALRDEVKIRRALRTVCYSHQPVSLRACCGPAQHHVLAVTARFLEHGIAAGYIFCVVAAAKGAAGKGNGPAGVLAHRGCNEVIEGAAANSKVAARTREDTAIGPLGYVRVLSIVVVVFIFVVIVFIAAGCLIVSAGKGATVDGELHFGDFFVFAFAFVLVIFVIVGHSVDSNAVGTRKCSVIYRDGTAVVNTKGSVVNRGKGTAVDDNLAAIIDANRVRFRGFECSAIDGDVIAITRLIVIIWLDCQSSTQTTVVCAAGNLNIAAFCTNQDVVRASFHIF